MEEVKSSKEHLLLAHQDVASHTRAALKFLTQALADNAGCEKSFFESIAQSDKASLALQRISSALSKLINIEQSLLERQLELDTRAAKNHNITRHDCELVISLVRGWGLLRDNCDDEIEKIIDDYENNRGGY